MFVQASWVIWRGRSPRAAALRTWVHAVAARRGRRIAIVALARRLTRILYAMWRDGTAFRSPARDGPGRVTQRGRTDTERQSRESGRERDPVAWSHREAVHVDGATPHPNPTLRDDDLVHSKRE